MAIALPKTDTTEKLNMIFIKRFDIDLFNNKLIGTIDDNLLDSRKFKLMPRDLIYLVFDIEKEFNITVPDECIDNKKFNNIRNILDIIDRQLEEKKEEII